MYSVCLYVEMVIVMFVVFLLIEANILSLGLSITGFLTFIFYFYFLEAFNEAKTYTLTRQCVHSPYSNYIKVHVFCITDPYIYSILCYDLHQSEFVKHCILNK